MARENVGAGIPGQTAATVLDAIRYAEGAGVPAVWLTTGMGPDAMMVFAAASAVTKRIRMGTAIVPTFPRHPVVGAQQAADIAQIAPGRFTLGVGPSHAPAIEPRYGISYVKPLEHVREFVTIAKALLRGEQVDFDGARYKVHGKLAYGADVPVIASALRAGSFELAGEIADGAVTWLCPADYLRKVALPAMDRGAAKAGRMRPRLVAHAFVALTTEAAALERGVLDSLSMYPKLHNYQEMFVAAGLTEAREGKWSSRMVEAVVIHGNDDACAKKVDEFLAVSGADEMILSVMPTGPDRLASLRRTLDWIGRL
jgi:alkanesulfonate monooxygenase SsuD/methylene tetrahydromethanopterin reductase-like flavin-dependent oxidoreductase (luciferase family)